VTILRWTVLLLCLGVLSGCDIPVDIDRPEAPLLHSTAQTGETAKALAAAVEPIAATTLLNEPALLHRFETTAEALDVWRQAKSARPILLLLSNNPHLQPVPEPMRKRVSALINSASAAELAEASSDRRPAPLMLPGMAIDAALRNGWFREMIWALPLRDPDQQLSLEKFTEQLLQSGLADETEVATLTLGAQGFTGSLRGLPFAAAPLPKLARPDGPVVVHIDLGYFQPLYKNEIATPLFDVMFGTLVTLRDLQLDILAVTFSYGHRDSHISLDVRFLGDVIAWLIENPARFDQPIPRNWQRQRDALYLANFFQKAKIRELYEAQVEDAPNTAWIKFNLYRSAAEHKEGSKALDSLAEAVALDPMFALEYMELSNMAYGKQRPDEALRMLELAAEVFHEDPFLKLQIVQLSNELGDKETVLEMLNKLRNLEWAETSYYPGMKQYLAELTTFVQSGKQPSPEDASQSNSDRSELMNPDTDRDDRQRIMHTNR
jgi:tetratricopeptide (TPR) repeat protein